MSLRATRRRRRLALVALAAAVTLPLAGACARAVPVAAPAPAEADTVAMAPEGTPEAMLEVVNGSNYDVRVYVIYGGQRRRLGLVTSQNTKQFGLPALLVGREVRFFADPVGARNTQRTDGLTVRPGQVVRFGLEKELRSHTLVYY